MKLPLLTTQGRILFFTTSLFFLRVSTGSTFNFFRDVRPRSYKEQRRIFGGTKASISYFPASCLLANDYKHPKCSGAIITPRFVVTAAHCIKPSLGYIYYNNRIPKEGDLAAIARIYRHPGFRFVKANTENGPDIVSLYHDIGLVESQENMVIAQKKNHLPSLRFEEILLSDVDVLGFGNKDRPKSPELLLAKLHVFPCFRDTWKYCACAESKPGEAKGACAGDSGGPVVHNGTLVGVTSLGPPGCKEHSSSDPTVVYTNVFTIVSSYVDIINDTINHKANSMTELRLLTPYSASSSSALLSYMIYEYAHTLGSININIWIISLIVLKIIE